MRKVVVAALALALVPLASQAFTAEPYGMDRSKPRNSTTPDTLPHCDRPLGTAAVQEPQNRWWTELGLSNPEVVIKLFALKSGCFRMVDRNAGLAMRNQESGLNSSGDLQRGSNIGRGQVLAADFFLIPDISRSNSHAGGGNLGGLAGGFLP